MLVIAEEDNANATVVAGALNLIGSDALFGRNWGCTYGSAIKNLHFELCYYQVCAVLLPINSVQSWLFGASQSCVSCKCSCKAGMCCSCLFDLVKRFRCAARVCCEQHLAF